MESAFKLELDSADGQVWWILLQFVDHTTMLYHHSGGNINAALTTESSDCVHYAGEERVEGGGPAGVLPPAPVGGARDVSWQ